MSDADSDADGVEDCFDQCPGVDDHLDSDGDGIADCTAPIPAVSQWGLVIITLMLLASGTVHLRRRGQAYHQSRDTH